MKFLEEIKKLFKENQLHYDLYENSVGAVEFDIDSGDWKHEHGRAKYLLNEKFGCMNIDITAEITKESDGDWYSAHYTVHNLT